MDLGTTSDAWVKPAPPDPVVAGLERKLDVLRAQLEACRAGRDDGAEGIATWSRLEAQSLRITELETLVSDLRGQLAAARPPQSPALSDAPHFSAVEAERAREEVISVHRTLRRLGQALVERTAKEAYTAARLAEAEGRLASLQAALAAQQATAETSSQAAARLDAALSECRAARDALLSSTCWRVTRPIRLAGWVWKKLW